MSMLVWLVNIFLLSISLLSAYWIQITPHLIEFNIFSIWVLVLQKDCQGWLYMGLHTKVQGSYRQLEKNLIESD